MTNYPVMFTLRDTVSGNGFLSGITLSGRALVVKEDDGKWWMYGVRPGAIAESGSTPEEAFLRFRKAYRNLLFDFANDSQSFELFRKCVEQFYSQPEDDEQMRWVEAFLALRSKKVVPDDAFFARLPQEDPETRPVSISVLRLDKESSRYMPIDNVPDYMLMPQFAAAA